MLADMGMRNANIGLTVGLVILFGGSFLFRNSGEGPLQLVVLATLISAFGVFHFLDEREKRRHDRSQ
jgi:hypothetical protein